MSNILNYLIRRASAKDLDRLLKAVLERYAVVFPEWEVSVITLEKQRDRNAQIDEVIALLNGMKT